MRRGWGHLVSGLLGVLLGVALATLAMDRKERLPSGTDRLRGERAAESESSPARSEAAAAPLPVPGEGTTPLSSLSRPASDPAGRAKPKYSVDELRALIHRGDRESSFKAAMAICELNDPRMELVLARELFAVGDPSARTAAMVVGRSSRWGPDSADLWCILLREDPSTDARTRAAEALGRLVNPAAIPALEEALRRDADPRVQADAAIALGKLGRPQACEEVVPRLVPGLQDPDGALRRKSVAALGDLRTPGALPFLGQALGDPDSEVRWRAVQGLELSRLKDAIPWLERAIADPNPNVAEGARTAIGKLKESGR
jgi:HEAT repeat protein